MDTQNFLQALIFQALPMHIASVILSRRCPKQKYLFYCILNRLSFVAFKQSKRASSTGSIFLFFILCCGYRECDRDVEVEGVSLMSPKGDIIITKASIYFSYLDSSPALSGTFSSSVPLLVYIILYMILNLFNKALLWSWFFCNSIKIPI